MKNKSKEISTDVINGNSGKDKRIDKKNVECR